MPAIIMPRLNYGAIGAINALGLTSGLKLCLDAGDAASLPAASATWNDLSGGAYHFNRGTTSGAESSDPSINGTAGGLSSAEYLGFDGGDWLTLAQANPAWVETIHKDNAKFAFCGWVYPANFDAGVGLAGTFDTGNEGFDLILRTTGAFRFNAYTDTGQALVLTSTAALTAGVWNFVAVAVDEAAGTGTLQVNGTQEAQTTTYTSPGTGNSTTTMQIGSTGESLGLMRSGSRLSMFNAWQATIPTAEKLMDFYNITRGRFGV